MKNYFCLQIYQPGDQGGSGDQHGVHEEPGEPEGGVSESNLSDQTSLCRRNNYIFGNYTEFRTIKDEADHPQALLDPFLLFVDNHHQHGADELRHREGHIDRHHGSGTTSDKAFEKRELEEGVKLPENCFHAARETKLRKSPNLKGDLLDFWLFLLSLRGS